MKKYLILICSLLFIAVAYTLFLNTKKKLLSPKYSQLTSTNIALTPSKNDSTPRNKNKKLKYNNLNKSIPTSQKEEINSRPIYRPRPKKAQKFLDQYCKRLQKDKKKLKRYYKSQEHCEN